MTTTDRRSFLRNAAVLAGAFSTGNLFEQAHGADFHAAARSVAALPADAVSQNEDYWSVIQRAYSVNPDIINLNNGGVSPAPIVVQEAATCPNCHGYRFDSEPERVRSQAEILGKRLPTSVPPSELH